MTSHRKKVTNAEKVAIITGIFTVIAAAIAGIFSLTRDKSAKTVFTATPQPQLTIIQPKNTAIINSATFNVIGTHLNLPKDSDTKVWIFVVQFIAGENPRFWLQRAFADPSFSDNTWQATAFISESDVGQRFEIYAVAVDDSESNVYLQEHMAAIERGVVVPFLGLPPLKGMIAKDMVSVTMGDVPGSYPFTSSPTREILIIESVHPPTPTRDTSPLTEAASTSVALTHFASTPATTVP